MNGFVNTLLSAALSWIRALISQIWNAVSSEDGGAFYLFFREHWLTMVIIVCAVCVLVDLLVYFFRWRPDYVWASRWRRLRGKPREQETEPYAVPEAPQYKEPALQPAVPAAAYAPLQTANAAYTPASQPAQLWQPAQETEEPAFDEFWDDEEPMELDWHSDEESSFGAPQPEPMTYFRDMQAGFAPAVPPEKLYTPSASYQQPPAETESAAVHPGLDEETFRQTIGLSESEAAPPPVMYAPAFRPFTATREPEPEKPQSTFQRFAQKARGFMALDDEQKTIHDLQSNVDVSKAFHEPVYPQSFKHNEE